MGGAWGAPHAIRVSVGTPEQNKRFMATLRKELEYDPIRVTTLMPGPVATNFARYYDPAALKAQALS